MCKIFKGKDDSMKQYNYLRVLLERKGIKTVDLSRKLGIRPATLTRKIQGKIRFSDKDIRIILDELSMTYEDVFNAKEVSIVVIDGEKFVVSEATASEVIEIVKKEVV